MASLNEVIHQPVRLRIMASLVALEPGTEVGFTYLADLLGLTDGNLGAHLRKLEEAGYVKIAKTFIDKKPHTYIAATDTGRQAFAEHVAALEAILRQGQNAKHTKER
jgi:DNA-binding MarR family transcriptional regulator